MTGKARPGEPSVPPAAASVPDPAPGDGAWEDLRLPLKFRLGDVTLFTVDLPLAVRTYRLTEMLDGAVDTSAPPVALPASARGLLLRSCPVAEGPPVLGRAGRTVRYVPYCYSRYFVDLRGTFADYCGKFSAKSRSTARRKVRKFTEFSGGEIDFRCYRRPGEVDEFYRHARAISEKTYQERLLDAGLPRGAAFEERMRADAAAGRLRAYLLFHDGRPVSYLYCPGRDGVLLYHHLGYDPGYADRSPGFVLQWLALEALFAEGEFAFLDFTEGDGEQKRFFGTDRVPCADVYFLRPTPAILCLVCAHSGVDRLSTAAGNALEALNFKSRVKRLIRSR